MKRLQYSLLALAVALLLPAYGWAQVGADVADGAPEETSAQVESDEPVNEGVEETELAQALGEPGPMSDEPGVVGEDPILDTDQGEMPIEEETEEPAVPPELVEEPVLVAEAPLPPTSVEAFDTPNSPGDSVSLTWEPSANETEAAIVRYAVLRSDSSAGPFEEIGSATTGATSFRDSAGIEVGETYYYRVAAVSIDERQAPSPVVSAVPKAQWFHWGRTFILILALLLSGAILFNIDRARRGVDLYVRRIAGLESVEEAIGRSTEMGKPVLFVPGIRDMDDIQTIASMSILAHVAKLTAEYDTPILVPNIRAVVMSTAQEVVKQAYLDAGRPDAYNPENIRYLTDDQFGYVAGVDGIMIRDQPAANFFLGAFFAESLILAETGASTGAIQIAGTAMPSQLPFFVAACDYTLIGEELFAASAYLAREPMLLGSLKGQDWGKFAFMIAIALGAIGATIVAVGGFEPDVWWNIASWFQTE